MLMLEAIVSLLEHVIDGENHTDMLVESKNSINKYLIRRRSHGIPHQA